MTDNEMKNLWQNTGNSGNIRLNDSKLITELDSELKRLHRGILRRDLLESVAAVLVILLFSATLVFTPSLLTKIGCGIFIGYGLLVIVMLQYVKKNRKPASLTATLKDYLTDTRRYFKAERQLLKNVLWWYLLPPAAGIGFFFAGLNGNPGTNIALMLVTGGVLVGVYFLNQHGVKKQFDPLLANIDDALHSLEE